MKAKNGYLTFFGAAFAAMVLANAGLATTYNVADTSSSDYSSTINGYISSASDGDTIQFARGRFPILSKIATTKSLVIKGAGEGTTSIVLGSSADSVLLQCNYAANKTLTISNISLKTTQTGKTALEMLYSSSGSSSPGLVADRLHIAQDGDSSYGGSRSGQWSKGVRLSNASHCSIKDSVIANDGGRNGTGLEISGVCNDVTVEGSALNFWSKGTEILDDGSSGSTNLDFKSTVFVDDAYGIYFNGASAKRPSNVTIEYCHMDIRGGGHNYGISFQAPSNAYAVSNLIVRACMIMPVFDSGDTDKYTYHLVATADSATIEGNRFTFGTLDSSTGGTGVVLLTGTSNGVINANMLTGPNSGAGIWIQSGCSGCTVSNNLFSGSFGGQILDQSSSTVTFNKP